MYEHSYARTHQVFVKRNTLASTFWLRESVTYFQRQGMDLGIIWEQSVVYQFKGFVEISKKGIFLCIDTSTVQWK